MTGGDTSTGDARGLQVLILGAGPNRIGQGIEFDYCCCHASFALRYQLCHGLHAGVVMGTRSPHHVSSLQAHSLPLTVACRDAGFETIMLNCNPETVSTDYDTSSRLYFEPLTVEVRHVAWHTVLVPPSLADARA